MAFDSFIIHHILTEMRSSFLGKRVDKIFQPEPDELQLQFRDKDKRRFKVSVHGAMPYFTLTRHKKNNPSSPPNMLLMLRKRILGGFLVDIQQIDFERIVKLTFDSTNELGTPTKHYLYIELMGRHSNVILTDEDQLVLESLKRVSPAMSSVRPIYPGLTYEPFMGDKKNFFTEDLDVALAAYENKNSPFYKFLYKEYQGFSPSLAKEFTSRYLADPIQLEGLQSLRDHFLHLRDKPEGYFLFYNDQGLIKDFHIAKLADMTFDEYESLEALLDHYYTKKDLETRIHQKTTDLRKLIDIRISRSRNKLEKLEQELDAAADAVSFQHRGEIILANLYDLKRGMDQAKLFNFYDNEEITLELDPQLSPQENAQWYFKKYQKLKTSEKELTKQIEETAAELAYLEGIRQHLEMATHDGDIQELRAELADSGYLKKKKSQKQTTQKSTPISYRLPTGHEVLVGKNNQQNDALTFKIADKKDLWFHTKDIPGSHVILRCSLEEATEEELVMTAEIAAYHSKGKLSTSVPVDFTEVFNVKKPRGAKPGFVNYFHQKTIYASPSDQKINALQDKTPE